MIDIILIVVAFISIVISYLSFCHFNKNSSPTTKDANSKIELLRGEKVIINKKSNRKRKSIPKKIEKMSFDNPIYLHQKAKENNLSVGELLLAVRINSLK